MERLGYYLPWVLSGTVVSSIAYGLLSLLRPSTSVARWVGFQILFGTGCGAAATGVNSISPLTLRDKANRRLLLVIHRYSEPRTCSPHLGSYGDHDLLPEFGRRRVPDCRADNLQQLITRTA